MADVDMLKVTLVKSRHGRVKKHRACADGLGLKKRHQTVTVRNTPENRGMIRRIAYMVSVEEI